MPPARPDAALETARALEGIVDKVRTFGGRAEGIGPIGLVAAFGLDGGGEAADRAAHAAMAIVKALERARRDEGSEMAVKLGLHAMPALVGLAADGVDLDMDDRRDLWPVLDELVERAPVDGVLVTAGAALLLTRRFELAPGPAIAHGPTQVLVGRERTGLGLGGRLADFVGRRHELELLRSRFDLVLAGQGQVVGIVGDAGIGKSRLVFEFQQSLGAQRVATVIAHCHAWGGAVPYLPVLEVLRAVCGLGEMDGPDEISDRLHAELDGLGLHDGDELATLLHFLGIKDGVGRLADADPQVTKARAFEILRQITLRKSWRTPLVVLLEDVHWIDRASEEYFASLVDAIAAAPVMLVCTQRPGYRAPWLERALATQIAVQPLGRDEGLSLARSVSGAERLDPSLLEAVVAKAEGNPFFLEELVRSVRDQGAGRAVLVVPDTIEDVLRSRIERLSVDDRDLLQRAAVIGREVPLSLLEALEPGNREALVAGLARLQASEFVYETERGGETEYCFRHTLTQEVAYASLEPAARRGLHARLVEAIERGHPDHAGDALDRLAHHAFQGALWSSALAYLREAGTRAAARSAHREAVVAFEQALAALAHLPAAASAVAVDVRFALRTSLLPLGEHRRIFEILEDAERIASTLGDRGRLARTCTYLTNYFFVTGDQARALDYGRRAHEIAEALDDVDLQLEAKLRLGQVHHALGEYRQAAELLRVPVDALPAERLHERLGLPLIFSVGCRNWLARALTELGAFDAALAHAEEGVRIAEAAQHPFSLTVAYWTLGHVRLRRGEMTEAVTVLERGMDIARTWSIRVWLPRLATALGRALARAGRAAEALPLLEQVVTADVPAPDQAAAVAAVAEGHLLGGRPGEAGRHAERALELARQQRDRGTEAWIQLLRSDIAGRGDP
ncbi:MAG TPA: AAA family ATPase, partial [Methylomirabilota bacterium]|nr:AAA family ATPase [Methylomirabilota bacterium]